MIEGEQEYCHYCASEYNFNEIFWPRWWYRRLLTFPPPMDTLNVQLHMEQFLLREIQNQRSDCYISGELGKYPHWSCTHLGAYCHPPWSPKEPVGTSHASSLWLSPMIKPNHQHLSGRSLHICLAPSFYVTPGHLDLRDSGVLHSWVPQDCSTQRSNCY